jgi:hypothetical protein
MRCAAIVMISIVVIAFGPTIAGPVSGDSPNIEDRILRSATYALSQYHSGSGFSGFLHSNDGADVNRSYTEDNALIALALSSYQESHFSTRYYGNLKDATDAVVRAQTAQGDFYESYDFQHSTWGIKGKMFCWDAYAVMGVAYAAYVITTTQANQDFTYWLPVVSQLRLFIDRWVQRSQGDDGAVLFSFADGANAEDVSCNGVLLMGLMYVAAFEFSWEDKTVATAYAKISERIANWLYSLQERNETSWGFGGFYSNSSRGVQISFENALAMFGLNSYYKGIGLVIPSLRTSLEQLRQLQKIWADMYEEKIVDQWAGVTFSRSSSGQNPYPKTTEGAAAMLAAMGDVWVNLGAPIYWNDSARIYAWMIGNNERSLDMQAPTGDFLFGFDLNQALTQSDLTTTSLALYGLIRAQFISIPGQYPIDLAKTTRTKIIASTQTPSIITEEPTAQTPNSNLFTYATAGLFVAALAATIAAVVHAGRRKRRKKR